MAEDITTIMRGMVRIVVKVVVKGMGGRLINGGGSKHDVIPSISFDRRVFSLFNARILF